ncbi:HNH endonuclease signature motif containing protein [Microbacterium jiangjiandongii]|uniref:HNH endonuclease signature motif containing protein n=1 Tax=Microbacterium jiangjiandongii TaxID=3049071 RepID=UPI00214B49BB|nr:HNH endonuclease signature motif containing protein [Microbacterium sp. zg.Y843]MCR2815046.1 HNH endonuclease [Microbacterium sp. zg.Y843]
MNSSPAAGSIATGSIAGSIATASHGAVISGVEHTRRAIAALQAEELQWFARAEALAAEETSRIPSSEGREREMPRRGMAAELAAVLRRSDRGMQERMRDAAVLVDGFPETLGALESGRIDVAHVRVIQDAGARITDPDARARFEQAALVVAERETPGRAKPIILMLAQRLDPVPLEERHTEAAAGRRVWVRDLDDGMAELAAVLPAPLAYAIKERLTAHAREIAAAARGARTGASDAGTEADASARPETGAAAAAPDAADADPLATDRRTTDQVRADVLTDLLLTGHASAPVSSGSIPATAAISAHVQITIPAATLTGEGIEPAELVGYGPIDPATARRLAATAEVWERLFASPTTGAVLQVDTYRPSVQMRRLLDARDEHCRFPGCRRPARQCDGDHTIDAARGGPTRVTNLANLCPGRHHPVKHKTAWSVVQKPDGILEWTSPTGRVYVDIPRRVLEFMANTAADQPAPF